MSDFGMQCPTYKNTAASVLVKTGLGRLRGIFVASTSQGSIKLWDNTSAAGDVLVNTFSPTAATYYHMGDVLFGTGLYITIANVDCTLFFF